LSWSTRANARAHRYKDKDIPELVKGTLPQRRVLDLAPGMVGNSGEEDLTRIISKAMSF
jgi:hydroxyacid-oxoacid transhydrogenase